MAANEVFAERLKQRMEEKGLTLGSLLGIGGVGPVKARRLLAGDLKRVGGYMIYRVAKFLECNDDWLLGKTEDPEPKPEPRAPLPNTWGGYWAWLTDPRYLGTPTPCGVDFAKITCGVGAAAPTWIQTFHEAGMDHALTSLTHREIQDLAHWILRRTGRRERPSQFLFVRGPKVVDLEAKRRLRVVG